MSNTNIIDINNFFDFKSTEAINRIAYTEEDAKYKLKIMKYMKDLGMKISIDDVGNICGTLQGKYVQNKSLVVGSHTDSVLDGGQFDGPVGVYMALKSIENYMKTNKLQHGNLKVAIYASEESTRFSKACLGSDYLSGKLSYEKIASLKDKKGITFNEAIAEYKDYIFSHLADYGLDISDIELVDKILKQDEISEAIESHIEQAEVLQESNYLIGAVDSIVKPLRGDIQIQGPNHVTTSAKIITELNKFIYDEAESIGSEIYRISVPQFNSNYISEKELLELTLKHNENELKNLKKVTSENSDLLEITAHGQSNHSGSTPMHKRKDAVLGLSKLILKLDELQKENPNLKFEFLGTSTKVWGANQIQDNASLVLRIDPPALLGVVKDFAEETEKENIDTFSFDVKNINSAILRDSSSSNLFVDVRQQFPATGTSTRDKLFDLFKKVQEKTEFGDSSISFKITSIDNPVQTTSELLENIKQICFEKKYPCQIMHSWAGHDLACVLSPNSVGKKVLFFIPSEGGSHNPNEVTTKRNIEIGTDVYSTLISQRLTRIKDEYEKEESR